MHHSTCYSFLDDHWRERQPLLESRAHAASVRIGEDGWWITGGEDGAGEPLDSTELQPEPGLKFMISFNLPYRVSRHCLVRLNETLVMLVGGKREGGEPAHSMATINLSSQV